MKKVLKIALLLLAASIFFAGCSNSSGDSSGGSGGGKFSSSKMPQFDLSDGDWDMDIHQYSKVIFGSIPHEMTTDDHVEMIIAGNDVTVSKATRSQNGAPAVDTTAEWNASLKNAKDAGNISAFAEDESSCSSSSSSALSGIDVSKITPTITYDENNSDTYYKVTVVTKYKYYDLFEIAYGNNPQALAFFQAMVDPDDSVYQEMEVVYTKK